MEYRLLGRTGLRLSVLGYGCGAVGGLMVRGDPAEQERAVARALEHGINYFDTAPLYGDGASERNLGRVLKALRPEVVIGTKVRLPPLERGAIGAAVTASLEASLARLGRNHVDLFQLHNTITTAGGTTGGRDGTLDPETVLGEVVPAFERLRREGKTRHLGFTAIGDTPALHRLLAAGAFASAQVPYNLLNPSAGAALSPGYPAQDYHRLLDRAAAAGTGVIAIRILAGGALSGLETRHPNGAATVEPIGSGADYRRDVARARRFAPLVADGYAASLVEAALRFVIASPAVTTALIGTSTLAELETAAAAIARGPLTEPALARVRALQEGFAGEPR